MEKSQNLKQKLLETCIQVVTEKINLNKSLMKEAQIASNEEEKSSAGDKYETGRAMMQQEKDKAAAQLSEAIKLMQVLDQLDVYSNSENIVRGSLVITDNGNFFIAAAIGQIHVENIDYFAISSVSPLGKELLDKKAGDSITLNGRSYIIKEVH